MKYYYNNETRYTIEGAPFNKTIMGWRITTEKGYTVAISCDRDFCERMVLSEELIDLLKKIDFEYQIQERKDQGYIEDEESAKKAIKTLIKLKSI